VWRLGCFVGIAITKPQPDAAIVHLFAGCTVMLMSDSFRLFLFPAMMVFAASSDLFTMTISNKVSLLLVAGFFTLALATGMSGTDMLYHLGAAAAVLVVGFIFFAQGWIGGGDAKLAAAIALWLGFEHLTTYLLDASIFGGVLTLIVIRFRLMPLPAMLAEQEWVKRLHRLDGGVPYGIALAAAALMIYPDTAWMHPAL
jgi:prepilin peptidase CpaA